MYIFSKIKIYIWVCIDKISMYMIIDIIDIYLYEIY